MKLNGQPKVYSYNRFSSKRQATGDSERRQLELAEAWASARNLTLDVSLQMIDRGISGGGEHRRKGAFGAFLKKVEAGVVASGSILLVENLDRFSREPVLTAMDTIISLLKRGITIITLYPERTYDTESVNNGAIDELVSEVKRANRERQRKSDLAKSNWKQLRLTSGGERKLTAKSPAWIKVIPIKERDRVIRHEANLIPEATEAIQLIFRLKLQGYGNQAIVKKLNETPSVWTPEKQRMSQRSKGWRESYIKKILHNRAVLGEFQPHRRDENGIRVKDGEPKQNYYPAVVTANVFNAVQKKLRANSNGKAGGRTGSFNNVLRYLAKCGHCGASMTLIDKGKSPKGGQYLKCDNARRSVPVTDKTGVAKRCNVHPVRYSEVEQTFLDNIDKVRPEFVLPTPEDQDSKNKQLRTRIDALNGEIETLEKKKKALALSLEDEKMDEPELRLMTQDRFKIVKETIKERLQERSNIQAELDQLERGRERLKEWLKGLPGLKKAIAKDSDARVRLNAHLKEFVDRIEIFPTGHEDDLERACDVMQEDPELLRSPAFKSFQKYVAHRLGSVDGRCFRVHFKGGPERLARMMTPLDRKTKKPEAQKATDEKHLSKLETYFGIQIAPPGSLAYRVEIAGKEPMSIGPAIGQLFEEFFDGRKPGFVPKESAVKKIEKIDLRPKNQ